jgi:hypothetical protein
MFLNTIKSSLRAAFFVLLLCRFSSLNAQNTNDYGSIHGNFQIDAQYYNPDSLIGAPPVPEKMLSNAYGIINYTKGKFSAGIRYEAYNNVMQGFDSRYKGQGITNRFARYEDQLLDITIGNIYDQFGSGLLFRTYYEPGLLYDNSLDGIRVISRPFRGLTFKGLVGKQRSFFTVGPGIVRGFDGEMNLKELLDSAVSSRFPTIILGGSFVSKYQTDQDPNFNLPENVGAYGGRINVITENFNFFGEYVYKENDPSATNSSNVNGKTYYSYKFGDGIFLSSSYAIKGLTFLLQVKRIDNLDYRSDRDATLQNLLINYLPATTKQHTYLMPAFFPYATQPKGELGGMGEIQYKFKKGSLLGGKYGTEVTLNGSIAYGLKQIGVDDSTTAMTLYKTDYLDVGDKYYHDAFIEINKKFNKVWKGTFMYANQFYNRNIVQFGSPNAGYENILSHIAVVDLTYKYNSNSALRFETQGFFSANKTNPNAGSWATAMLEWSPNTHWFVAVLDQYNFSNPSKPLQIHYLLGTAGYTNGPHRISMSVGKQRAGIFCVGGVCRNVPASNGVAISITSSF